MNSKINLTISKDGTFEMHISFSPKSNIYITSDLAEVLECELDDEERVSAIVMQTGYKMFERDGDACIITVADGENVTRSMLTVPYKLCMNAIESLRSAHDDFRKS